MVRNSVLKSVDKLSWWPSLILFTTVLVFQDHGDLNPLTKFDRASQKHSLQYGTSSISLMQDHLITIHVSRFLLNRWSNKHSVAIWKRSQKFRIFTLRTSLNGNHYQTFFSFRSQIDYLKTEIYRSFCKFTSHYEPSSWLPVCWRCVNKVERFHL